ncbi:MAG: hypothetical protein LBT59_16990 [Clostridiales bacterium]|jgi:hypothetical protein|nr:hypothetical protein [Clostridiales bacterium]
MVVLKSKLEQNKTKEEIDILYAAHQELYKLGKTSIVCPRCSAKLAYKFGSWGEVTYCTECGINRTLRGL